MKRNALLPAAPIRCIRVIGVLRITGMGVSTVRSGSMAGRSARSVGLSIMRGVCVGRVIGVSSGL